MGRHEDREDKMTDHPAAKSPTKSGPNRRHLVQALAAGAAASGAIGSQAAAAQETSSAVLATAVVADYVRDPTRWGSAEIAALFPGFEHVDLRTNGAVIRLRHGGSGPPLLLLHGNPENHVCWHKIAARLAQRYHVVLPDLRGYGDSSLPEAGPNHINYTFRAMAQDMVEVMEQLGYRRYFLAGHDRGARAAHRMCLDHAERVMKVCLMDVVPNYHVWTNTTKNWAIGSWHWSFMAQPEPFPERLISAVPAEYFIKSRMVIRGGTGLGFLTQAALDEYVRCYTLKTITGSCRDFRASPTSDFEMDAADKDRRIEMPTLILWGARGQTPERTREFEAVWHKYASNVVDTDSMPCGHYIQEEMPDHVYERFTGFFVT
jgi:haloacetate dehalogenase